MGLTVLVGHPGPPWESHCWLRSALWWPETGITTQLAARASRALGSRALRREMALPLPRVTQGLNRCQPTFPRQGLSLTYASQVSTQPWPCPWPPSVPAITGRRHPPRGFFHLEHGTCCYLKSLLSAPRTLGGSLGAPGWVAGESWGALGLLLGKGCPARIPNVEAQMGGSDCPSQGFLWVPGEGNALSLPPDHSGRS